MPESRLLPAVPMLQAGLVLLLPLLGLLALTGHAPLLSGAEAALAAGTREMLARGDFLTAYTGSIARPGSPVLLHWLQALAIHSLGTEAALRLPSVLATALSSLLAGLFMRQRFGAATALATVVVTATALGPLLTAHMITVEALFNLLLALTLFDTWRHLETRARAPLLRSHLWIALGLLARGPAALLLPASITLLYCASRQEWKRWPPLYLDRWGGLLIAALLLPWCLSGLILHGTGFIDGLLLHRPFDAPPVRLAGAALLGALLLPMLMLPWSGPLLGCLREIRSDRDNGVLHFLWIWAGCAALLLPLSGAPMLQGAFLALLPLSMLVALHRERGLADGGGLAAPTLLFALCLMLPFAAHMLSLTDFGSSDDRIRLGAALALADLAYYAACLAALLLWLVIALRSGASAGARLLAAALIQALLLHTTVLPWMGIVLQEPIETLSNP